MTEAKWDRAFNGGYPNPMSLRPCTVAFDGFDDVPVYHASKVACYG